MVFELISHVDAQIDAESLRAFVAAYQTVTPESGRVVAVPIMLRLALIENLRRSPPPHDCPARSRSRGPMGRRLQDMRRNIRRTWSWWLRTWRSRVPVSSASCGVLPALVRQNPVVHLARSWLEQRLAEQGLSIEQLVHLESQNQAADRYPSAIPLPACVSWRHRLAEIVET